MPAWRRCGFTLLELLLVLVIVAVIAATVATAIPNIGSARRLQAEAERLALAVELARGEALRGNEVWGLSVHEGGYAFHTFDDGRWEGVTRAPLMPWQVEEGVAMALAAATPATDEAMSATADGDDRSREAETSGAPEVAILPGGETTPFAVTVGPAGDDAEGMDERTWVVQSDGFSRAAAARQSDLAPRTPLTLR